MTFICCRILSSYYICESLRQSHRRENRSSILTLHTLLPLPHLSPFISLSASWGTWKSYCQIALCLAQWSIVSALSSSGQNESGIAVHDDRIYVVGGYSIWTNEPLACIQVRDVAFRFSFIIIVILPNDQICDINKWCEYSYPVLFTCWSYSEVKHQHTDYKKIHCTKLHHTSCIVKQWAGPRVSEEYQSFTSTSLILPSFQKKYHWRCLTVV